MMPCITNFILIPYNHIPKDIQGNKFQAISICLLTLADLPALVMFLVYSTRLFHHAAWMELNAETSQ